MGRSFNYLDVYKIINTHQNLIHELSSANASVEAYRKEVLDATNALLQQDVLQSLRRIPVEEINKDKRGFRIKTLKDNRILTVADVFLSSEYTLSSFHGISEQSASAMKHVAKTIALNVLREKKINIGVNEMTVENIRLISAISKYRQSKAIANTCKTLLVQNQTQIQKAIEDLKNADNVVKWLFASKSTKQAAEDGYRYLSQSVEGNYGKRASALIKALKSIKQEPIQTALKNYAKDIPGFLGTLEAVRPGITNKRSYANTSAVNSENEIENKLFDSKEFDSLIPEEVKNRTFDKLIQEYLYLSRQLKRIIESSTDGPGRLAEMCTKTVENAIHSLLSEIPVEDLAWRDKNIPVDMLRKNGFKTIEDIFLAKYKLYTKRIKNPDIIVSTIEEISRRISSVVIIYIDRSNSVMNDLISVISRNMRKKAVLEKVKTVYNNLVISTAEDLKLLSTGQNRQYWILGSEENKKNVYRAYERLSEKLQNGIGKEANEIISLYKRIDRLTHEEAWKHFDDNQNAFLDILKENIQNEIIIGSPESPFPVNVRNREYERLLDHYNGLIDSLRKAINKDYRQPIKDAANVIVEDETYKLLETIPIEELNRDKKRIRIKTLREHGFNTIKDILQTDSYSLQSSGDSVTIKETAKEIAEKVRAGVKLKISSDNRTPNMTNLIIAVFQYINILSLKKNLTDAYNDLTVETADDLKQLSVGRNRLSWLFSNDDEKSKAEKAYDHLCEKERKNIDKSAKDLLYKVEQINDASEQTAWDSFAQNSVRFINVLEDICPELLGNDDALYGLPEELAKEVQNEEIYDKGLRNVTLRRYQEWGVKYILHQEKVLLGDEMGLGKTVQAIATMVSLRKRGATHFLVVCPASILLNWSREITEYSFLRPIIIHGQKRRQKLEDWIRFGGVGITTYETTEFMRLPESFVINLIIVDEAHYIKNNNTNRTINTKKLINQSDRILLMTGTALENKPEEMVALINMLRPEIASKISTMLSLSQVPVFRQTIVPVYYRRKREDVLTDLPDLIETKEWCSLSTEEYRVYVESLHVRNYAKVRQVSWNIEDLKKSSKAKRMLELIQDAKEDNRKVIVFSFFLDTISKIKGLLGNICFEPITGSLRPERRQEIIDEFTKAEAGSVLLAQIQAGGVGLNIQAASVVIICEPQLKPSIENQAISRAYRMRQNRNVLVYRLLAEDTIDERITDTLGHKQELFDEFADVSVAAQEQARIQENSLEKEAKEINTVTFEDLIQKELDRVS